MGNENYYFAEAQKNLIDMFFEIQAGMLSDGRLNEQQVNEQINDFKSHLVGNGDYFENDVKYVGLENVLSHMDSKTQELYDNNAIQTVR